MSHPVNDELLENIWEQVQEEFPFLPVEEQNGYLIMLSVGF